MNTTTTINELTFGVEIETTCLNTRRAAAAIATAMGWILDESYGEWFAVMPDGRKWAAVIDGSIGYENAEIVSPICKLEDMEMVQQVVRSLRAAGASTSSSTGIHVHVGVKHLPVRALVNLVHLTARFEDLVGKSVEQLESRAAWSAPTEPRLLDRLVRAPKTIEAMRTAWYEAHRTSGSSHYDRSRYHNLNLHSLFGEHGAHGTAEFRMFNATLHAGKVRSYITLCLAMVVKAANSKHISRKAVAYNPAEAKYRMRSFMKDLRLVGPEFKTVRTHLMAPLPGTCASPAGYVPPRMRPVAVDIAA